MIWISPCHLGSCDVDSYFSNLLALSLSVILVRTYVPMFVLSDITGLNCRILLSLYCTAEMHFLFPASADVL